MERGDEKEQEEEEEDGRDFAYLLIAHPPPLEPVAVAVAIQAAAILSTV